MIRKPLDKLQETFFGKISRGEWVKNILEIQITTKFSRSFKRSAVIIKGNKQRGKMIKKTIKKFPNFKSMALPGFELAPSEFAISEN